MMVYRKQKIRRFAPLSPLNMRETIRVLFCGVRKDSEESETIGYSYPHKSSKRSVRGERLYSNWKKTFPFSSQPVQRPGHPTWFPEHSSITPLFFFPTMNSSGEMIPRVETIGFSCSCKGKGVSGYVKREREREIVCVCVCHTAISTIITNINNNNNDHQRHCGIWDRIITYKKMTNHVVG